MPDEDFVASGETAFTRVALDPARYAGEAADLLRRVRLDGGGPEALVVALRAHAWGRHVALDNTAAKRLLDEAVRVAERHGVEHRLGDLLVKRAITQLELGNNDLARRDLERAEPLVGDTERLELLMQRALLDHNAGHLGRAVDLYRRVLAEGSCPPVVWVKAANNLSVAETQRGRPGVALRYLERAAALVEDLGPLLGAIVASSLAWATYHDGQITRALERFEEAGRLYRAAGAPIGEHYLEYADTLTDLRLLDDAYRMARLAVEELGRNGARLMSAEARLQCARLALALGDVGTALADGGEAERDLRRQRRPAWAARAAVTVVEAQVLAHGHTVGGLRRLRSAAATLERQGLRAAAVEAHLAAGRAALAIGHRDAARRHLGRAGELAHRQPIIVRLRGRLAAALLADAEGAADDVLRHCRGGLQELARYRAALPSVELRTMASGHGMELGELGLRVLLPNAAPRALAWLERTRAASLLDAEPPTDAVDEDVIALRTLEHQISVARREQGFEPPELVRRHGALETRIRRRSWRRGALTASSGQVVSLSELRALLRGGWLVEYAAVDGRIHAVVVGPRRARLVELGPVRAAHDETSALLFALRRMLDGGRFARQAWTTAHAALHALAARLVAPLDVPADAPLVIVPSRSLLQVPWSPLRDAPTTVSPSATLWARGRNRAPSSGRVAVVAGPDLPGAVLEARAVASIHREPVVLLPPRSTVEATIRALAGAELAHLGCHGRLRWDNPLFSSLELADGPVTALELFERGVAPHHVVLGACESAVQRGYDGGEVLGLVSALMTRGTAAAVASVMELPDGAAAPIIVALHRQLARGCAMGTALHLARREAADDAESFVAACALSAYGAA